MKASAVTPGRAQKSPSRGGAEENGSMAIELNDFVEKVLRDLAGFVPVGAKVWFEVSPTYLPPLGFDDSHAIIERTTNPNGDKVTFCVKQCFDKATQQE